MQEAAILGIDHDINSLSDFKRNTPEFLRELKETVHPAVLTNNAKAELIVQDTASCQKLLERTEQAERMDALRTSVADMRTGRVVPAEDMLADMRKILAKKQGRSYSASKAMPSSCITSATAPVASSDFDAVTPEFARFWQDCG
ncbi:MAG: prevent-host-death protein [Isosphaeraceae bacterium]